MANIHDIAKKAGVSATTVSRVLNNHKYVSDEKRRAVKNAIDELNYTPNRNAIDLIRGETKQIGVIIPYNNNQAFDQMLHGALNKSIEHGYSVLVLPTRYDAKKELEYLSMLQTKMLDAIIITSRSNVWGAITPFTTYGPIISCEYTDHAEIGCSYMDRYASYVDAFHLLKENGHEKVAFTTARGMESKSTIQTFTAYEDVFGKPPSEYVISSCYSLQDGYRAAQKLLQLKEKPTAIYANGDEVATGIYQYAVSLGMHIPNDLALLGQENQPMGVAFGISTVDHQLIKVGEQAFQLAIEKSKQKIKIPYQIIHRSSI
ncbi:LacI family DNA-binding transcriptional regulator [Virgibacillus dakarensis]|uniref:LacI family transcriptional regulator n=1 Tax=Lentibacillus populi TaxID=1827502 RepID=A0A9W5U2B1_9BACI|nr:MULTISPECIES: LacI family DNA-binding transcriptional regulator [Bacillaceae]MTW87150.1 LacI family DNA-binding transcriptional regulator [Virgibacillus dakarensis]GGB60902.1 LacI family transcriptional regulator [Lentibacillus populi]